MRRTKLVFIIFIVLSTAVISQDRYIEIATANDYSYFFDENPARTTYAKLWTPTTLSLTATISPKFSVYSSYSYYFLSYHKFFDLNNPIPYQTQSRNYSSLDLIINRSLFRNGNFKVDFGIGVTRRFGFETQHINYVFFPDGETVRSSNVIQRDMTGNGFSFQSSFNYRIRSFNFALRSKYNRIYERKQVKPQMTESLLERNPHMISFHFSMGYLLKKW